MEIFTSNIKTVDSWELIHYSDRPGTVADRFCGRGTSLSLSQSVQAHSGVHPAS